MNGRCREHAVSVSVITDEASSYYQEHERAINKQKLDQVILREFNWLTQCGTPQIWEL